MSLIFQSIAIDNRNREVNTYYDTDDLSQEQYSEYRKIEKEIRAREARDYLRSLIR